jgi:hypothetical protein
MACDAAASDGIVVALLAVLARLLRCAPAHSEEALPETDGPLRSVWLRGTSLATLLRCTERLAQGPKGSRRLAIAYAACIAQPQLMARPALHEQPGGEGAVARAGTDGPLLAHLHAAVDALGAESKPPVFLQALTARLMLCWRGLVSAADAGGAFQGSAV